MAKILIVDDSAEQRQIISVALTTRGHAVVEARDGKEGLERLAKERPDLVVMDCQMPVMDGWQACSLLRAAPATKHIPVIMCTAQNTGADVEKCLQSGATDYISKPVDLPRLAQKVDRGLRGFKLP